MKRFLHPKHDHSVEPHPEAKVLSVDGGGIRRIMPAMFIAEIERRTAALSCELFDLIAGTSTGGIIAMGLAVPTVDGKPAFAAADGVAIYEDEAPKIFSRAKRDWCTPSAAYCAVDAGEHCSVGPHPGFNVLFLDAALSTTWIAGVQGLIFGFPPLRFLDGQKVLHWIKATWVALVFLGVFAFVHTMGHPGRATPGKQTFWSLVALFGGLTLASLSFWAYFRSRKPRQARSQEPPPEDPPTERQLVDA